MPTLAWACYSISFTPSVRTVDTTVAPFLASHSRKIMWQAILGFGFGAAATSLLAWQLSVRWARRQRKKELQLVQRTQRVEKLAELGVLTSGLAHEIRNPLSTIKMNLQLLAEDIARQQKELEPTPGGFLEKLDTPEQVLQRYLRKIETVGGEADRLAETLNDFLRYAGKLELHPARCDVNEMLDDLIDFFTPQALSQGVQVRQSLASGPLWCKVDTDLLKQAILNLLLNATQAMAGGGELIVRTEARQQQAKIDVIDTGPGIDPEEQEKIFEAYFTTKRGGTGLGLPTCRRILEAHGGHIELVSEKGKGSNFTIYLPLVAE
jgi:signal transduction histidine kinase